LSHNEEECGHLLWMRINQELGTMHLLFTFWGCESRRCGCDCTSLLPDWIYHKGNNFSTKVLGSLLIAKCRFSS